jgi:hypothetical protein
VLGLFVACPWVTSAVPMDRIAAAIRIVILFDSLAVKY